MVDCSKERCPGVVERNDEDSEWTCNECGETYGAGAEPDMSEVIEAKLEANQAIKDTVDARILERVPAMIDATLQSVGVDDRLEIDRLADSVEAHEERVQQAKINERRALGQSPNVARLNMLLEEGVDLTPEGYDMPTQTRMIDPMDGTKVVWKDGKIIEGGKEVTTKGSYFVTVDGFRLAFKKKVEDEDMPLDVAYELTCADFKLTAFKRPTRTDRLLAEIPEKARGGYRLGRGDAWSKDAQAREQRLLGANVGGSSSARGGSLTDAGSPSGPSGIGDHFDDTELDELEKKHD